MKKTNMEYPLVSILMSTYNPIKEFMQICLNSIVEQSYKNIEVVLINDGSEININEILEPYFNLIKIIYIQNEVNMGLAKSLNKGIEYCNGDFIARMDDDDIMLPNRIEKQVQYLLQHKDIDGVLSNFYCIDNNNNITFKSKIYSNDLIKQFLKRGNNCCHSSLMINYETFSKIKYNEKYIYAQDIELYFRFLQNYKLIVMKEHLIQYRQPMSRMSLDKEMLSFFSSYIVALKFLLNNKKAKYYCYFFIRTLRMLKFVFIDKKAME